jgi:hypothetical protein
MFDSCRVMDPCTPAGAEGAPAYMSLYGAAARTDANPDG